MAERRLEKILTGNDPKKASLSIHNKEGSYIFQKHGDNSIIGTFAGTDDNGDTHDILDCNGRQFLHQHTQGAFPRVEIANARPGIKNPAHGEDGKVTAQGGPRKT